MNGNHGNGSGKRRAVAVTPWVAQTPPQWTVSMTRTQQSHTISTAHVSSQKRVNMEGVTVHEAASNDATSPQATVMERTSLPGTTIGTAHRYRCPST